MSKNDWTTEERVKKPKMQKDKGMQLNRHMPVRFGKVKAQVFGGPFLEYVPGQRRLVSVKMAAEIEHPHDIGIPTEDFSTPSHPAMHAGIRKALVAILSGNDLYVGCMGGIGRTGLFMACLAKVMFNYNEFDEVQEGKPETYDPVAYVRSTYYGHAVETRAQQKFVEGFDTTSHVDWLNEQLAPQKVVEKIVEREVQVERVVYHFNPFRAVLDWMDQWAKIKGTHD